LQTKERPNEKAYEPSPTTYPIPPPAHVRAAPGRPAGSLLARSPRIVGRPSWLDLDYSSRS